MSKDDGRFLENYLPYILRRADQALSAPFYALLTRENIPRSEWRVLAVLHELGELNVQELTAASLSPQPTVTHAVRRLEERGLVLRVAGTHDRRQRFISMTTAGTTLTASLLQEAKELEANALAPAGDLSGLVAKLQELTKILEANIEPERKAASL